VEQIECHCDFFGRFCCVISWVHQFTGLGLELVALITLFTLVAFVTIDFVGKMEFFISWNCQYRHRYSVF
jgi:hypothetical protein